MSEAHVVADQSDALAFLANAKTHGLSTPPLRIDTHGAVVFLAGENAYKMKRAVRFPFMDLSTIGKRKAACEAEIAVNAADAPTIYLGAVPITRGKNGLELGGAGEAVEWVVHMRRFDERQTLDHVADQGGLSPTLLAKLVRAILASHARAPLREGEPAAESLSRYLQQNKDAFGENTGLFPKDRVVALTAKSQDILARDRELLLRRGRAGCRLHFSGRFPEIDRPSRGAPVISRLLRPLGGCPLRPPDCVAKLDRAADWLVFELLFRSPVWGAAVSRYRPTPDATLTPG